MHDEVVIFSVDECCFKGSTNSLKWQVKYTRTYKVDEKCRLLMEDSVSSGTRTEKEEGILEQQ